MSDFIFTGTIFIITLVILIIMQNLVHQSILKLFYSLTHNSKLAVGIYTILLFPGVLLHEVSHFLVAGLLGVRTTSFSLLPEIIDDGQTLQMGYVEYDEVDRGVRYIGPFRKFLIGIAPLSVGFFIVLIIVKNIVPLESIYNPVSLSSIENLNYLLNNPTNLFVLVYLLFAIVNTMFPSIPDLRITLPFVAIVAMFLLGLNLLGLQISANEILANSILSKNLSSISNYLSLAFTIVIIINLFMLVMNQLVYSLSAHLSFRY